MVGVDTNVLLRLLVVDDERQHAAAKAFFAQRSPQDPAFIGSVVLAETVWILRRRLGYSRSAVEDTIRSLLESPELVIEEGARLSQELAEASTLKTSITDFLVAWAAQRAGCRQTVTFDVKFAKAVPATDLLQ